MVRKKEGKERRELTPEETSKERLKYFFNDSLGKGTYTFNIGSSFNAYQELEILIVRLINTISNPEDKVKNINEIVIKRYRLGDKETNIAARKSYQQIGEEMGEEVCANREIIREMVIYLLMRGLRRLRHPDRLKVLLKFVKRKEARP